MNSEEVESCVRKNITWTQLPPSAKQQLGNSTKEYDKCIVHYSLKNQLRYKGSLVQRIRKDESKYYEDLLEFGWKNLLLFPYHLSDVIIKGLGVTPFHYYINMLDNQMAQEKSYDSLPNFTAADCLRLIGIGRNQYIDLMNSCRSNRRFGLFKKSARELLPNKPIENITILPWWLVQVAYITEEDIKNAIDKAEHCLIDQIIDNGTCPTGYLNYQTIKQLFNKGFIYFDVPIEDDDYVVVPPLEGFVMNRVQGDFFETLLYKIFVSIDENTTVSELAKILEVDSKKVKDAVSLYCRLGFAKKKNSAMDSTDIHPSWYTKAPSAPIVRKSTERSVSSDDDDDSLLKELNQALEVEDAESDTQIDSNMEIIKSPESNDNVLGNSTSSQKKIGVLFDSTLTAYLMMGNLSLGLKTHAVTMFEVGKLSDESLDSLVTELDNVTEVGEGEAEKYYVHARNLKQTIQFLRLNQSFKSENDDGDNMCLNLDLLRTESLQSLDSGTTSRLLNKNYALLVSTAPLSNDLRPVGDCFPPHLGPVIPEVTSIWFKMYIYHVCQAGPPSLLLPKGYKITRLPRIFENYTRLLVTSWGHDPSEIPMNSCIPLLCEALQHSAVLVQAHASTEISETKHIPFPLSTGDQDELEKMPWWKDKKTGQKVLPHCVDVRNSCGYISLIKLKITMNQDMDHPENGDMNDESLQDLKEELDNLEMCGNNLTKKNNLSLKINNDKDDDCYCWTLHDIKYGLPLFDSDLNKEICQKIVINSLWKMENLSNLKESGEELSSAIHNFIQEHQDIELNNMGTDKICMTPADRKKSPVPLPTRILFFNGRHLENF